MLTVVLLLLVRFTFVRLSWRSKNTFSRLLAVLGPVPVGPESVEALVGRVVGLVVEETVEYWE